MALVSARVAGGNGVASNLLEPLESRLLLSTVPTWLSVGPGGGGSFFSPSISPYNASEIYTPSDMGGLYHTTDAGATWQVVDGHYCPGERQTAVQFTNISGTLYYLGSTGEVIKSTNGGTTWASVPNAQSGTTLFVDYNNPGHQVLFSGGTSFYCTSNNWASYSTTTVGNGYAAGAWFDGANIYVAAGDAVYYSTNTGSSFNKYITVGIGASEGISSFAGSKQSGTTRLFIVTVNSSYLYPGEESGDYRQYKGVYTIDVGQTTWTKKVSGITSGTFYPWFVVMPNGDINDVYIAGGSSSSAMSVLKSTNAGGSWTSVFKYTNNQNIQTGWEGYNNDATWGFPEMAFGLAVAPNDPNTVIETDEGGATITTDGGTTWRAVYDNPADLNAVNVPSTKGKAYRSSGLDDTTVWGVTWVNTTTLWADYTDIKGSRSTDSGTSWYSYYSSGLPSITTTSGSNVGVNTTYSVAVQPTTGYLFSAVSNIHDIYESEAYQRDGYLDANTSGGAILTSTNQGQTWTVVHNFNHPVVWVTIDPSNPNRAFASVVTYAGSAGGIYVSSDINLGSSSHWYQLSAPPRTQGHPWNIDILNDGSLLVTYAMRWTSVPDYSASSGVFLGTGFTQATPTSTPSITWTDKSNTTPTNWTSGTPLEYAVHDITVDPSDPTQNTWWVGVWDTTKDLYYPGAMFKTTDRGATWKEVLTGFSGWQQKAWSQIAFNPLNSNEAYVTTNGSGLWYSSNMQAATPTFTQVANYPFVHPIRVVYNPYQPREVWITSFGDGLRYGINTAGLLAGDTNMDGSVTFADYQILEANFGKTWLSWKAGDFNGDQAVSFADYQLLEANFGKSSLAAPSGSLSAPLALSAAAPLAAATTSTSTPVAARSLPTANPAVAGRFVGGQSQALWLEKAATTSLTSDLDLIDARWTKKLRKPKADDASIVDLLASPLM
jgi:photosystem II stability/assembly factor-like uncharacterized protein